MSVAIQNLLGIGILRWFEIVLIRLVAVLSVKVRRLHLLVYHFELLLYGQNFPSSFLLWSQSFSLFAMIRFGVSRLLM